MSKPVKADVIPIDIFKRELALCKELSGENNGECNWGKCKDCGVIPLLYKLYKGELLEDAEKIKLVKDRIFKI